MARKPSIKLDLKVDLSDWELGDWPFTLAEAADKGFVVDVASDGITFTIPTNTFDRAARVIAEDAIQAFFGEELYITATAEGLELKFYEGEEQVEKTALIPWAGIMLANKNAGDALKAWLHAELEEIGDGEG